MNIATWSAVGVIALVAFWRRGDLLDLAQRFGGAKVDASKLPASLTNPAIDDVSAAWEMYRRLNGDTPDSRKVFETAVRSRLRSLIAEEPKP